MEKKSKITNAWDADVLHPLYSAILLHVVRQQGTLPGSLLSPNQQQRFNCRHTAKEFFDLLQSVTDLCPQPHLAMEFGNQIDLSAAGVIGQAVMSAATVGESFDLIRRYYPLTGLFLNITRQRVSNEIFINFDLTYEEVPERERCFFLEALINSWAACYRVLTGRPFTFKQLSFDYSENAASQLYRDHFNCPINYNSSNNLLVLDMRILQQATLTNNSVAHHHAVAHCEAALLKYGSNEDSITEQIKKQLQLENCLASINLKSLATRLNQSSRTLNRHLQMENVRFQHLLDEERKRRACRMLRNSLLTTDQIAEELGYSDASNFRRAFKKWTGSNPRQYRQST